MESQAIDDHAIEGILSLNRDNYEHILKQSVHTVIEVYSKKCPGCKRLDPIMPALQRALPQAQVVRMDALNEVSFLKNVDKTPTFLVYSRSSGKFEKLGSITNNGDETDDSSSLLVKMIESI